MSVDRRPRNRRMPVGVAALTSLTVVAALAASLAGCAGGNDEQPEPGSAATVQAGDIPVARTPPGGWTEWPEPVLARCTEALVEGAPDLRGRWRVAEVEVDGATEADHPALGAEQRIEQCGDRIVITASGIIHDSRADGTEANAVRDVAERDKRTPITVVSSYEDGVHVLRPVGVPVEVRRRREGERIVWDYVGFTARLDRVGDV